MTDEQRFAYLFQSIESHDRQIGELVDGIAEQKAMLSQQTANIAQQAANIDKLVVVSSRDGVDIAALARIAERHEQRINELEGDRP